MQKGLDFRRDSPALAPAYSSLRFESAGPRESMASADSQVRVKVYQLEDGDTWTDRGIGFCTLEDYQGVLHLNVVSEGEINHLILDCIVQKGEVYQKQDSALIVWTEPSGEDLALSFEEQEGCLSILNQITEFENAVKGKYAASLYAALCRLMSQCLCCRPPRHITRFISSAKLSLFGHRLLADLQNTVENALNHSSPPQEDIGLPLPSMGTLSEIERIVREAGQSVYQRDKLVAFITGDGYLERLQDLHETCEELDATEELHTIYSIARQIILLNDSSVFECIIRDEHIIGIAGMLEYDPENPVEPGTFRSFLSDSSRFKEIVPIPDAEIRSKIHQTFRIQYLRDVVLPQIVDEGTLPVINALLFFNQAQIANYIHHNDEFLDELFAIVRKQGDSEKKRDVVLFVRQFCNMSKSLPITYRVGLYRTLCQHGLFSAFEYALQDGDQTLREIGVDVLLSVLEQDRALVRSYMLDQQRQECGGPTLLDIIVEGSRHHIGSAMQILCSDAIRALLDTLTPSFDSMGAPPDAAINNVVERETNAFLALFYDAYARDLMAPLFQITRAEIATITPGSDEAGSIFFLCDLLSSIVRAHGPRAREFVQTSGVMKSVLLLFGARAIHLRLAALRFVRVCVAQPSDAFMKYVSSSGALGLVINLFVEMLPRDNLASSACQELLMYIADQRPSSLLPHILGAHSSSLERAPDMLRLLQSAYDNHLRKVEEERNGGVATPTVGAGRRSAVSIDMLIGQENRAGGMAGLQGSGPGGPWASAITDDIEDAYLESFDDNNDLDHSSRTEPALLDRCGDESGRDGTNPAEHSPELENLQDCLDLYTTKESSVRLAPYSNGNSNHKDGDTGSSCVVSSPPLNRTDLPLVLSPPIDHIGKLQRSRSASPDPTPLLKRQHSAGSRLETYPANDSARGRGSDRPVVANGRMSVADAFPDSRPISRKLSKRAGANGRVGARSHIKISMAQSARSRAKSMDSDLPDQSSNVHRGLAAAEPDTNFVLAPLVKRQRACSSESKGPGLDTNGRKYIKQQHSPPPPPLLPSYRSNGVCDTDDEPSHLERCSAETDASGRGSPAPYAHAQGSPGTSSNSAVECGTPPKKARTASS
ncbi:Platinum sensitivity protein [Coemansia guatemalensis]|uniref:Platinum sensitivity protein n=1 Tax=Coemansia guatemalensis TaxID=2761395 RepID=A0A9W8HXX1_9FUNG|nr:Platinum sensitivity protein [Coemansia guatemalensis]